MAPVVQRKKLHYEIYKCSTTSTVFSAQCIMEDNPSDQNSRWSSESNASPQFIILKLFQPSVVTHVTFGKYEKQHVCNLKRFQVYGGMDEFNMMLMLERGLKNDSIPETFQLCSTVKGHYLPVQYLKIVPLQSWGPSYNYSIWYFEIEGDNSTEHLKEFETWHKQYREKEAIRLCLKYFRRLNFSDVFESLQAKTNSQLEDPLLTELFDVLVKKGDYVEAENICEKAVLAGMFDDWIGTLPRFPIWEALILDEDMIIDGCFSPGATPYVSPDNTTPDEERPEPMLVDEMHLPLINSEVNSSSEHSSDISLPVPTQPGPRGGHQMVIDSSAKIIYMLGGWDGNINLSDFWSYDMTSEKWTLISQNTEVDGGPSPRSCHKMVLDTSARQIFVLGRYLERSARSQSPKSDFYLYDIPSNSWTLITDDTESMDGPPLVYDHQICIDQKYRVMYLFGGQILSSSRNYFCGFYEYNIPNNSWRRLLDDGPNGSIPETDIKLRTGHSMLFHEGLRKLFIFGGQRKPDYLCDLLTYNVDTGEVEVLVNGESPDSVIPAIGFTQKATIDCERKEIYVMTGLYKEKDKEKYLHFHFSNSVWVYKIDSNTWSCIYRNDQTNSKYWSMMHNKEPRPRYAHQLVYDEVTKAHYLFGGNPNGGSSKDDHLRLGDFWKLVFSRPSNQEIIRQCQVHIRKSKFSELALNDSMSALTYLHNDVAAVMRSQSTDKKDTETREYQLLAMQLFQPLETSSDDLYPVDATHKIRVELFERLASYFSDCMTHPKGNITDLILLSMDPN